MTTLSVAPGKTTRTRTRAITAPATSDPAMTRATGVDRGTLGDPMCSRPGVVVVSTLMAISLSQWGGGALRWSVASMTVAHPGQMAGMCAGRSS